MMSERDIIRRICSNLQMGDGVIVGAGLDDCAVIEYGDGYLTLTTDMLHRKTDFPGIMTGFEIGWSVVASSLSDLAGMGSVPVAVVVSAGIPPETDVHFIDGIAQGMNECAREFSASVVGGDVDRHDELTLVGCALGRNDRDKLVTRAGASPGDLLCVTGHLGTAAAAMSVVQTGNMDENWSAVKDALLRPVPRVREGIALAGSGAVTSMTDISDGLAASAHDIAAASDVRIIIREGDIPLLKQVLELAPDSERRRMIVLHYGGDFELLFTTKPDMMGEVRSMVNMTVIGKVVTGSGVLLETAQGKEETLPRKGYSHFGDVGFM